MDFQAPTTTHLPADGTNRRLRTSSRSSAALRFDLRWQSDAVQHCDSLFLPQVPLWRAELPQHLKDEVMNKPVGHRATRRLAPGHFLPDRHRDRLLAVRASQLNRRFLGRGHIEPRRGRFYPKGMLVTVQDSFAADRTPFRVVGIEGDSLQVDLNHPLAGKPLEVTVTISAMLDAAVAQPGPTPNIRALLTADGPGMQGRWQAKATDFFADAPFVRMDEDDPGFYARPRLVDHLDSAASAEIRALYGRLIPRRSRILDLMSSWQSHLPEALDPDQVVGLGMNADELAQNPMLTERMIHDLNAEPRLPFADRTFDAVVCTVSVEYLTDPLRVFRELARVLTPGGIAVMTFSNRWFPTKVTRLWEELHEFERPGLVLEYFRATGCFRDFNTWSLRGLPRPADDKYAHRLHQSDPVHAVWARCAGQPTMRL
ncbi:methyltransferase domain-containing protein [uncultured Thiohalocapsa sp.]|uniref:methyltransferase domain-containing protein n=1 Tax=uncultured Thiohalocapsa sp. TaxID=768990 RepID=UPI0025E95963|nr:methyltransferase domain-containing protein [uncultured Thiohalocapsa sp.]